MLASPSSCPQHKHAVLPASKDASKARFMLLMASHSGAGRLYVFTVFGSVFRVAREILRRIASACVSVMRAGSAIAGCYVFGHLAGGLAAVLAEQRQQAIGILLPLGAA